MNTIQSIRGNGHAYGASHRLAGDARPEAAAARAAEARAAEARPEGAPIGWARSLASKIQADTSPEALRLKEVLEDLKGHRGRGEAGQAARQADRTALEDALRAYVEKLQVSSKGMFINQKA